MCGQSRGRGAGEDMGVALRAQSGHLAIAVWEWGAYYGDAKTKGASSTSPNGNVRRRKPIPCDAKAAGLYMICTMSKHAAEAKAASDALMFDYRAMSPRPPVPISFSSKTARSTPRRRIVLEWITRQTVIGMLKAKGIKVIERHIMPNELTDLSNAG